MVPGSRENRSDLISMTENNSGYHGLVPAIMYNYLWGGIPGYGNDTDKPL